MSIDFDNDDNLSDELQGLLATLQDVADEVKAACEEMTDAEREFNTTPCAETARKRLAAQHGVSAAREAYGEARHEFEDLWQYEFGMDRS